MLTEITIRNFAVIREARLEFGPGLNALTGETGAGKSIVLDALGAVLGERTASIVVRTGEERAFIEAIFVLPDGPNRARILGTLTELGIEQDPDDVLILSRDIVAEGRSTARVNGRAVTVSALSQIGEYLVDIHGQSAHLSLLRPAEQLDLLDRYARVSGERSEVAHLYRRWSDLGRRIEDFETQRRERSQRLDLLRFQIEEIDEIDPQQGEDTELEHERSVLSHAERLSQAALTSHSALSGGEFSEGEGALDMIRVVEANLDSMATVDSSVDELLTRTREALFTLEEVESELRDYGDRLQFDPDRLEEINHRLAQLRSLTRKYGPDLDTVIEHRNQVQSEINDLTSDDFDLEELQTQRQEVAKELSAAATALSQRRQQAASKLSQDVVSMIARLNMGRAEFTVDFGRRESANGIEAEGLTVAVDETGIDRVQFLLAANAGETLRPLAQVASGGETARLMLAMKSILSAVDETPTLVFDEIDVGVGGRSGSMVGETLWGLTDHHQVIVITHLPQVAAFADRHITMVKQEATGRTETSARALEDGSIIHELAAMLDGEPVIPESEANARALWERSHAWKESRKG